MLGGSGIGYEVFEELDGKIDTWGCAVGSGGTLLGVALALKERGAKPMSLRRGSPWEQIVCSRLSEGGSPEKREYEPVEDEAELKWAKEMADEKIHS